MLFLDGRATSTGKIVIFIEDPQTQNFIDEKMLEIKLRRNHNQNRSFSNNQ